MPVLNVPGSSVGWKMQTNNYNIYSALPISSVGGEEDNQSIDSFHSASGGRRGEESANHSAGHKPTNHSQDDIDAVEIASDAEVLNTEK